MREPLAVKVKEEPLRFFLFSNVNEMFTSFSFVSESQIQSEKDDNVKLKQLQYLLVKVLPVLRAIYTEQDNELEIETAIRGMYVWSLVLSSSLFLFFDSRKKTCFVSRSACDRI